MQEGVRDVASEKLHGAHVGQLCGGGILLRGDDDGGVTAGGLIDDALPVEVEILLIFGELDGEPLAVAGLWTQPSSEPPSLDRSPRWQLAYVDGLAAICVRTDRVGTAGRGSR